MRLGFEEKEEEEEEEESNGDTIPRATDGGGALYLSMEAMAQRAVCRLRPLF